MERGLVAEQKESGQRRQDVSTETMPARDVEFAPPAQAEGGWSFVFFAWRRKWMVAFGIAVALGLGYLYFVRQTPIFESSAEILVVHRRPNLPIQGVEAEAGYDDTHAKILRSPAIISRAIEEHNLASLPSLRASGNPVGTLISGLKVTGTVGPSGDLIRFSYQSPLGADCPEILNAVIAAYEDFLDETYQNVNQETADLITRAKDELDRQITESEKEYVDFRYEAPLLFAGGSGENRESGTNMHESRLASIEAVRSTAVLENSQLQAKIEAIEDAIERGSDREALNLMIGHEKGVGSASGQSVVEQLFPMMLDEQMLLEKYGPDHPEVKANRRRMDITREHLLGMRKVSTDDKAPRDFYEVYVDSLREQIKMNEQTITQMDELFEKERKQAKSLASFQVSDETYRSGIQRKERLFDAVVGRLEEINLMQDASGIQTQEIHPPSQAAQIAPDMHRILITSGVLGLLAGLGLAYLVDVADRRFRSPDDIREYLGLPIIGHIPVIAESSDDSEAKRGSVGLAKVLRTVHSPRGRVAEAYRAVRTALYFSVRGKEHQVIQITSPSPSDGKTTLAANLCVSIASSGKETLLIDADFRRPRVHRLFDLDNSLGFASVIQGTCELAEAIRQSPVEHLSILGCGPRPDNPAELLTSRRFEEFVDVVRDRYDLVVIDTPPLLAVTDPSTVAARVDSVLLVMRLLKNARGSTSRALGMLDSMGIDVLGIVVNGIGRGSGYGYGYGKYGYARGYGYGYGGYGYGRGRGYGYGHGYGSGYGYGYGDGYGSHDGDKSYYMEDDEDAKEPTAAESKTRRKR